MTASERIREAREQRERTEALARIEAELAKISARDPYIRLDSIRAASQWQLENELAADNPSSVTAAVRLELERRHVLHGTTPIAPTGRAGCPDCGADIIGNDPHAPDCPRGGELEQRPRYQTADELEHLKPWLVTETPHDPPAGLFWRGPARDALHALDLFAEAEGFATYSSQLDTEEGAELVGAVQPNGSRWAIFTNTTVYAIPGELEQGSHVTRAPIPGEQPSPATAAIAAAADVLLPLTRDEAELLAAIVDFGGVDNDNLSSLERSTAEAIADTLRAALNRG